MQWAWASLLIRSAAVLAAAEILRRFPRKSAPADRHRILLAAFGLLMMWPLFSAAMPEIHLPLWPHLRLHDSVTVQQAMFILQRDTPAPNVFNWPVIVWLTGVLLALAPLTIGYLNVLRMARGSTPLVNTS
jgi:hypothetical protein